MVPTSATVIVPLHYRAELHEWGTYTTDLSRSSEGSVRDWLEKTTHQSTNPSAQGRITPWVEWMKEEIER